MTWKEYCWYNFGIDIGEVTPMQYENILGSDEFKAMEQYPSCDHRRLLCDFIGQGICAVTYKEQALRG